VKRWSGLLPEQWRRRAQTGYPHCSDRNMKHVNRHPIIRPGYCWGVGYPTSIIGYAWFVPIFSIFTVSNDVFTDDAIGSGFLDEFADEVAQKRGLFIGFLLRPESNPAALSDGFTTAFSASFVPAGVGPLGCSLSDGLAARVSSPATAARIFLRDTPVGWMSIFCWCGESAECRRPVFNRHHFPTGLADIFHTRSAYSCTARSDEKRPVLATLATDMRVQHAGSRQHSPTACCRSR